MIPSASAARPRPLNVRATFLRVVDARTLQVRVGRAMAMVRLIGVQPPTLCSCHGAESETDLKTELPARGGTVELRGDPALPRRDARGRLLAYVAVPHGLRDVNQDLIANGDAKVDRSYRFTRLALYEGAEGSASAQKLGLWFCSPEPASADVSLAAASTSPVRLGTPATLTATATNNGPGPARLLVLTSSPSFWLSGITWTPPSYVAGTGCTSVTPNVIRGPFDVPENEIRCTAPLLDARKSWQVQITALPVAFRFLGTVQTQFVVRSCTPDPEAANNTATAETRVLPPP